MTARGRRLALAALLLGALALVGSGCAYTRYQTETKRSATEQLLLTQSIERAVSLVALPKVKRRAVHVTTISLAPEEAAYLRVELEAKLRLAGAEIVSADEAEIYIDALVAASGTVARRLSFGVPPLPTPFGTTPGLPFLRILKQRGYTRLSLVVREADGASVSRSEPVMARAHFDLFGLLFLAVRHNSIYPGEGFSIGLD
ncbi:MAG: hypothetical protein ACE5FG_06110 [Myxococcota bacterium]